MGMAGCLRHEENVTSTAQSVMFVRPKQARLLRRGPASIVVTALREIDTTLSRLSQCRSAEEFEKTREEIFADYVNLSHIVGNSFAMSAERAQRQLAINASFKAAQKFFAVKSSTHIGHDATAELVFCLDTLRRAYGVVAVMEDRERENLPPTVREQDRELASQFSFAALWSQFHIDYMRIVITEGFSPVPVILEEILQGARLSVMAYSYARQGSELRKDRRPFLADSVLDEEDRELLQESFVDYAESDDVDAES